MSKVTIEINGIKKDLNISDVIACKNEEEARLLFNALDCVDFTWCSGTTLIDSDFHMSSNGTGYCIDKNGLSYSPIYWYKNNFDSENNDKSFNVMYFNELFTPQVTVEELWEVVEQICKYDGMSCEELLNCFGNTLKSNIVKDNTPQSLVSKYNTWKKSKEIKIEVGDIFEYSDTCGQNKERYIILCENEAEYEVVWEDFTKSTYNKNFILKDIKVGHKDITTLFTS